MHADATQLEAISTHVKGKMRLVTLDALDGRTRASRRARELIEAIEQDLGGADRLSEGSRQLVQRAAVLGTYIENCEAQWLAGDTVELSDYLAAINSQRRVLTAIGLERRARDITGSSFASLRDRLQSEADTVIVGESVGAPVDNPAPNTAVEIERTGEAGRARARPSIDDDDPEEEPA
jgi:hypothetical protein